MTCIQLHSSLLPMHAKLKPQQHHKGQTTNPFCGEPSRILSQSQHFPSATPLRTKTLPHSIVVAATSPAQSGDISSLLPLSALLLSIYFVANFIVPEFLTKYFGYDKLNEDQKVDDADAMEDR